ncbi:unnamed protein product [Prorocentrum cordatum]|uniref:Uncharacterized protein n=1 Tax=Prorocentrum cordatum TaxID=2364126 RepID=A0ABN9SY00_9DINO|nr:unnamed protein product [Polarella glacialis]
MLWVCMASQALAKLGPPAKAALRAAAGEAFSRQLHGFSTADKALLMWSLAKSRVAHPALCRLLVQSLAADCVSRLQRDIVSATLWAAGVICPALPAGEEWAAKLVQDLCEARPWAGASPFEVANAAWAFGQLPPEWVGESWPALLASAERLSPGALALHELCNFLSGLGLCPTSARGSQQLLEQVLCEVVARARSGARISMHDKRSLKHMLSILSAEEGWPRLPELEELGRFVSGEPEATGRRVAPANASAAWMAAPGIIVAPGSWQEPGLAPADQAAGFTRQPGSTAARCSPRGAGGASAAQSDGSGCQGPDGGHAEAHPPRARPKALSFTFKDVHDADIGSPDLTPRHPGLSSTGGLATDVGDISHSRAAFFRCVAASTTGHWSADAPGSGETEPDARRDASGHCVQLRNTFIHVECSANDEEDSASRGARQRARSVDTSLLRAAASPRRSPRRSPALRPLADPGGTRSAGNSPARSPAPLPPRKGGSRGSAGSGGSGSGTSRGSAGALAFQ